MSPEREKVLIVLALAALMLLAFAVAIVVFVLAFQRRKFRNLRERERMQAEFQQELLQSSIEIQESTLQLVGKDLHDNIGQVLAVVRLYLSALQEQVEGADLEKVVKAEDLLVGAMKDLRVLAHSLNANRIMEKGLSFALQELAEQVNGAGKVACRFRRVKKGEQGGASLRISGEHKEGDWKAGLSPEREIILFRICQELVSNALRHSGGGTIQIEWCPVGGVGGTLSVRDNGKGIEPGRAVSGQGLVNVRSRTELLQGEFTIGGLPEGGTLATVKINAL